MAGFYIHVPFRASTRSFDESYTEPAHNFDFSTFVSAVQTEIRDHAREYATEEALETIYIGGGRPTMLLPSNLRALMQTIIEGFGLKYVDEITLEANPADLTLPFLEVLREMDFNRLSLEVLSFDEETLEALDAPHTLFDIEEAISATREAGFDDVSVDLVFGVPGQSADTWEASVKKAVELDIPHVTVSELPDSNATGDDEAMMQAQQFRFAMQHLESNGYTAYELTHFAKEGHVSAHQLGNYKHVNYLGAGPSAHSFWWRGREEGKLPRRWSNVKDVETYIGNLQEGLSPVSYRQTVDYATLGSEYLSQRLRLSEGLNLSHLKASYSRDLRTSKADLLNTLEEKGLITFPDDQRVVLTQDGRLVADGIIERLLR